MDKTCVNNDLKRPGKKILPENQYYKSQTDYI